MYKAKKSSAPHLKQLLQPWLRSRFDPSKRVSAISIDSFDRTFSAAKCTKVLLFASEDFLLNCDDALFHSDIEQLGMIQHHDLSCLVTS